MSFLIFLLSEMSSVTINVSLVFVVDVLIFCKFWLMIISDGRVIGYINFWIIGHNIF